MSTLHLAAHDLISGFTAFVPPFVAAAILILAAALVAVSTVPRLSGASRVSILVAALVTPLLIGLLQFSGVTPSLIGSAEQPRQETAIAWAVSTEPLTSPASSPKSIDWPCLLALIWITGFFIGMLRLAIQAALWRRVAAAAVPAEDPGIRRIFEDLTRRYGVTSELVESDACLEPVVIGFLRPRVVLPSRIVREADLESLHAILAHELAHVARRDNLIGAVVAIVRALFWMDPLHHVALRHYLVQRERASDERALESGCGPEHLIEALRVCSSVAPPTAAAACMSSSQIPERIELIMSHAESRHRRIPESLIRVAVVLTALTIAASAALLISPPAIASPLLFDASPPPSSEARVSAFAEPAMSSDRNMIRVAVDVRDASGAVILTPTIQTVPGVPFEVFSSPSDDGVTIRIRGQVDAEYNGRVDVSWLRDGRETRSESAVIVRRSRPSIARSPTAPEDTNRLVTLSLQNADLHEALRIFSQLTGKSITADPGLEGKVTIEVVDTPWLLAMVRALEPLNLTVIRLPDGSSARVIRRVEPPPPPPGVHRVGGNVTAPRVVTRVEPVYPAEARRARIAGMVILEMVINEEGEVENARVLKPLPFGLDQTALDAVRQWKFEPGMIEGKPVKVLFNITINFRPSEESADAQRLTVAPMKIAGPEPIYPAEARAARTAGIVVLEVSINEEGAVTEVTVGKSLTSALDAAAVAAVRQWVFSPGQRDGKAVASKQAVTIPFALDE
jgi:TonB family protein